MGKDASAAAWEPGAPALIAAHSASAVSTVSPPPARNTDTLEGPTPASRERRLADLPGSAMYAAQAWERRSRSVMRYDQSNSIDAVNRIPQLGEPPAGRYRPPMPEPSPSAPFGQRLHRLRERAGLSQTALARLSGLAQGRLREIENGTTRSPGLENLLRLAKALEVSVAELMGEPDQLAEPDAAPYQASDGRAVAVLLAPNAERPEPYRIGRDMLAFGFRAGDVAILDAKGAARPGDLVVANLCDPETGEARTVIRRFAPPFLAPPDGGPLERVEDAAIFGPILASWRTRD